MSTAVTSRRVTVTEIAHLAKVSVPAVSNWRKRYRDFPVPVELSPSGDFFDLSSVLAWMELHGRATDVGLPSADRALWQAADHLRGELTLHEAVLVVLQALVVYRHTAHRRRNESQGPSARLWQKLLDARHEHLREVWADVVRALEREDDRFAGRVLELPRGISDAELARVLESLGSFPLENVRWGSITSAFLRRAQGSFAARAGGLATPASITNLMVQLLAPVVGTIYDPAAGHAMVLAEAAQQRVLTSTRLVGQEVLESSWRIGYLHLLMQDADFVLAAGDTLRDDRFRELRADRIALEPPLGERIRHQESFLDERWRFGTTTSAEWMWAQHLLFHLAEGGVGVMTVPVGALARGGRDARIRAGIVVADLLDAVIELPPGLVPGTTVALALMVFERGRANRTGRVLFVDARQLGLTRRGRTNEITMEDVERIAGTVVSWRQGTFEDEPRFAATATTQEVLVTDAEPPVEAVLTPRRFVRYAATPEADDREASVASVTEAVEAARRTIASVSGVGNRIDGTVDALHPTPGATWPLVKLRDLLVDRPQTGVRQDPDGPDIARPWIATRLVTAGTGRLKRMPDEATRARVKDRLARRGDLLLVSRGIDAGGRIGCATVELDGEVAFAESLTKLSLDVNRVHPDYLRLTLTSQSGRTALAALTTGSVIGNLRPDAFGELEVRLPDLETQRRVVDALASLEEAIEHLSLSLNASRTLLDAYRDEIAVGRYGPAETPPSASRRKRKVPNSSNSAPTE